MSSHFFPQSPSQTACEWQFSRCTSEHPVWLERHDSQTNTCEDLHKRSCPLGCVCVRPVRMGEAGSLIVFFFFTFLSIHIWIRCLAGAMGLQEQPFGLPATDESNGCCPLTKHQYQTTSNNINMNHNQNSKPSFAPPGEVCYPVSDPNRSNAVEFLRAPVYDDSKLTLMLMRVHDADRKKKSRRRREEQSMKWKHETKAWDEGMWENLEKMF